MSILHTLLNLPFIQQLGWSLLHFIWQGILIGIACGFLLKLPFVQSARAGYRICLGGLLLCAAAPVITFFVIQPVVTPPALLAEQPPAGLATAEALSTKQDGTHNATQAQSGAGVQTPQALRRPALFIPAATQLDGTPVVSMLDLPDAEMTPQPWHEQWAQKLAPYVPWLVVLWFPLALLLSLRLGWQWGQTRQWVRNATDCQPQSIGIDFSSLCKQADIRFSVRLLESLRVAGPLTVGFIKPVILVPVGFFTHLSPEHIEAILLHELAHIRRRDFLINLITSVVTALLFYHPVVWWLDRRTRLAREICCDELAAASCGDIGTYAHALANLETWRQANTTVALAANDGSLLQRIRALAGQRTATGLSDRSLANLTAIFTLALGTTLLLQFSPSAEAKDEAAGNLPTKPAPSGVVIGTDGKPLAGAQVVLYHMEYFYGLDNGIIETVQSDKEGRFAFTTPLTYATYQGDPEREEYYAVTWAPEQAVAIAIFDRSATTTQDTRLRLSQPETRTVKVTDRDGNPLAGALVNVHSISTDNRENWANFRPAFGPLQAVTDADGIAVFNQLPKGDISFRAQKEGYSPNWSGCNSGEKTEVDILLRPGASVSGRVTLTDGSPASNITVYATPLWPLHDFTPARTDADGDFTISGLYGTGDAWHADGGTGAYRIGIADPLLDATPQDVTLGSGQSASGLQLVARSGTQVTGILLDPVSHKPVAFAELYVTTPGNRFSILSDAEGRFRFRTLPGVFEVRFQMPPQGSYVLQYAALSTYPDSVSEMIANYPASVTLYTPSEVRKLIHVRGRVFAPDGKPAANVTVAAEIMTPGRLLPMSQNRQDTGPVKTDAEGYYQFTAYPVDLPMRLNARGNNGFAVTETAAVPVDAPQLADITLQPAKTAKIRIVDLDGKPFAKQRIAYGSATRSSNPQRATGVPSLDYRMEQRTTTDADGIATLRNLSPDYPCDFWLRNEAYSWKRILPQQIDEKELPTFTLSDTMQLHFTDTNGTPLRVERAEFSRDSLSGRYQRDEQIPLQRGSLGDAMIAEGWLETPKKTFLFDGPGMPIRLWVKLENGQTASVTGQFPQFDNRIYFTADVTFRNLGEHAMPFTLKEGEAALLILGDDNKPLPNATAQIIRYKKEPQVCAADANGWCLLTGLTNGQYEHITISAPHYAPEWISDLTVGESRTVPISQRTRLKGQLTAPDGSNSGKTKIELRAERKGRVHSGYYGMQTIPYLIETDSEGRYDVPVTPGVYSVRGQSESGHFLHVESLAIDDGQSASLPQSLTIPAQLELVVTDSASGKPAAGARIAAMQTEDLFSDTAIRQPYTRTSDAEGRMVWESLPPWKVALLLLPRTQPDAPASPYVRGWSEKDIYDNGRSATFKQRAPRGDEGHDVIQFELQPGEQTLPLTVEHGIHVSGNVLLPDELPEEGRIIIVAVPENQSLASAYTINKFDITVDRESGNFSGWLPAGNGLPHRVCAYYWSDNRHPSGYLPTALSEPFDSKPGDAFTFELSMRGGGFLTGRLTDADGNPRAGEMIACVPENRAGGTYDFSRAITDAEGRFTVGPIRASNYGITLPQYLSPDTNAHETQQHDAIVRDGETTDLGEIYFLSNPQQEQ